VLVSLVWLRAGMLTCSIARKAPIQQIVLRSRIAIVLPVARPERNRTDVSTDVR
jgi:hypothetical protein